MSSVKELEGLLETVTREMQLQSRRFVEIDQLKASKLERLRNVQVEFEAEKKERQILSNLLQLERDKTNAIANNLSRSESIVDSLRREVVNLNSEIQGLQTERKKNIAQTEEITKKFAKLKSEQGLEIQEKRLMIDQLTNAMSEAATQLMETQDTDKGFRLDLEKKERQIFDLGHEISNFKNRLFEANERISDLQTDLTLSETKLGNLVSQRNALMEENVQLQENIRLEKNSIHRLESEAKDAGEIQKRLISELEALPVINQRLESDCLFLREDMKTQAQRMKDLLLENESLSQRVKLVDSILTPEQRAKSSLAAVNTNSFLEVRKLQVETMELRMRLVDTQGARDKAQSQVLAQSETILKLEKQLMQTRQQTENNIFSPSKRLKPMTPSGAVLTPKSSWKWQ